MTGVDHKQLFDDPEDGSSLWSLAVDPAASLPGVGAALTRTLAGMLHARGRAYLDLSVAHDNAAAIGLYEKLGFQRVPVLAVKRKNAINEPLFTHPPETSTISTRTRASSPTRPSAAASGSRCSTRAPERCGCRTAAALSSRGNPCRSSPPRSQ